MKFPSPVKLPFYNLFRERAAILAAERCGRVQDGPTSGSGSKAAIAERRFTSADGLLVGRPDLIDVQRAEIVDYKTGVAGEEARAGGLRTGSPAAQPVCLPRRSGRHRRLEGNYRPRRRRDRDNRDSGANRRKRGPRQARAALADYNAAVDGRSFSTWRGQRRTAVGCAPVFQYASRSGRPPIHHGRTPRGVHLEGIVIALDHATVQATPLVSLQVDASRGTLGSATVFAEQIPVAWTTVDGDRRPEVGDIMRIVDGHLISPEDPIIVQADRSMTSVWRVRPISGH